MPQTYRFSESPSGPTLRVKAFGLGSAGCSMVEAVPSPRVAVSTSSADLERSSAERKVLIGQERLVGVYSSDAKLLKHLPSVAGHEVLDVFNNTDLAFLMCGLGGVSGSLGTKVFAEVARARNSASVSLVATPFSAESARRRDFARRMLGELRKTCTLCVGFGNDALSTLAPHTPLSRAFALMNGIMVRPVMDLCATLGRLDLGPLGNMIGGATAGSFGLGIGRGDERTERAVDEALGSPWFDFDLSSATCAIAVYSSADPWEKEADQVLSMLGARLPSASLAMGSYADASLGDRMRLSLILCREAP